MFKIVKFLSSPNLSYLYHGETELISSKGETELLKLAEKLQAIEQVKQAVGSNFQETEND